MALHRESNVFRSDDHTEYSYNGWERNAYRYTLPTIRPESLLEPNSRPDLPSALGVELGKERRGSQVLANPEAGRVPRSRYLRVVSQDHVHGINILYQLTVLGVLHAMSKGTLRSCGGMGLSI